MRIALLLIAVLLGLVPTLSAQRADSIAPGTRVRITLRNTQPGASPVIVIGPLVALRDSAISVRNDSTSSDVIVPLAQVERLEVSHRDRGASARNGGLIGILIGGVLGYAAGSDCKAESFVCFDHTDTAMMGASAGAGLGLLLGYLAGGQERWRETTMPFRVSVAPATRTQGRTVRIIKTILF